MMNLFAQITNYLIAKPWVIIGFVGQFFFMMRFVVQWMASERAKKSVMPVAFWFFSIGGGIILLVYALYQHDPVFIVGQGLGLIIYLRNLAFIFGQKAVAEPPESPKTSMVLLLDELEQRLRVERQSLMAAEGRMAQLQKLMEK